jgi:putative NADH-flavin reductase
VRVVILGSTGRIGSLVLARCLEGGHEPVVLVRDPARATDDDRVRVVTGDIADPGAIREAVTGADAVIAAVGPRANRPEEELVLEDGMRHLVSVMATAGVSRLITLSGAAVDAPRDQKPFVDRVASRLVRRLARHVVGAKQREFEVFSRTSLEWTALRPPLVRDGPARGYRLDARLTPGARVTREDVAAALHDQLGDRTFLRASPFVLPGGRPRARLVSGRG